MKTARNALWNVLFGMASIGSLQAADLPMMRATPIVPVAPKIWTGFYLGAHIGGGWADNQIMVVDGFLGFPAGTAFTRNQMEGVLGGGYGGWNYQFGSRFLVGIEGDYSVTDVRRSTSTVGTTGFTTASEDKLEWIATVAGRLGFISSSWLFFVKGGWAWAGAASTGFTTNAGGTVVATTSSSGTRDGWLIGAGIEWNFSPSWTAKLQYEYVDFGSVSYDNIQVAIPSGVTTTLTRSAASELHMVKLGAAYRF